MAAGEIVSRLKVTLTFIREDDTRRALEGCV